MKYVKIFFDKKEGIYVATIKDIGIILENENLEKLLESIETIAPELMVLNKKRMEKVINMRRKDDMKNINIEAISLLNQRNKDLIESFDEAILEFINHIWSLEKRKIRVLSDKRDEKLEKVKEVLVELNNSCSLPVYKGDLNNSYELKEAIVSYYIWIVINDDIEDFFKREDDINE